MKTISDYTTEELRTMLAKTIGVQGGADRVAAIEAALAERETDDQGDDQA